MEVPGADSDWRSPQFRQKVVAQIEDAMRKAGTAHSKSSTDMESHVYMKAKSREEYLSLVARLIIHFRDFHKKNMGGGPDPMNALNNLAGTSLGPRGGPGAAGIGPLQMGQGHAPNMGGAMVQQPQFQQFQQNANLQFQQQLRAQQLQQHHPQLQHQQNQAQNQMQNRVQQQQQQQQMVQLHLQAQSLHMVQHNQPPHNQPQHAQPPHSQPQGALGAPHGPQQGALGPPLSQPQSTLGAPHSQQQGALGAPLSQQQQGALGAPHCPPQSLGPQGMGQSLNPNQQHVNMGLTPQQQQQQQLKMAFQNRASLQQQHQAQLSVAQGARAGMPLQSRMPRPTLPPQGGTVGQQPMAQQVSQHAVMSSPSPLQAQTPQPMPPPPQPSPQPPSSQPNSVSSGPAPSPSGVFQPSPSPQPAQSPSTARTPQSYNVSSPGTLNTPGNPSSVMSPGQSLEDQQYMEKLKQLSKYVEPLSRMINKIDKNEDRKKDLSKMKSLLNILTDPNTRCPLKTLQKCEIALEKLKNDMAVPTPPPPAVAVKQQYLCQPLLDVVMANLRSPVFNHSLYRTFAPPMTAIHGPPILGPLVSGRKRKLEEEERSSVPNLLQGEVSRLDVKFSVNLDSSLPSNNGTLHLLCRLDDKSLPSVPPLQLSVPADYPEQSPLWTQDQELYESNSFLQSVHRNMASKLLQLPDRHSVTELLQTWAQSVRQACLSA
ncbi:hypothetical protein NQD34_005916 [Periophthalmus magnuspinnatus]|nr:hypothetical protein NQD34_005916 [Periophthalmus magnuspinnatus]